MLTFLMPSSTASSSPLTTEMSRHRFCFFLTSRRCHEKSRYRSRLFLAHRRCRERPFAVTKIRSICILPYQLGPSLRMHCFAFLFKQTWTHPEIRGRKLPEIVVSPKDPEIGRAPRLSATARPRLSYPVTIRRFFPALPQRPCSCFFKRLLVVSGFEFFLLVVIFPVLLLKVGWNL